MDRLSVLMPAVRAGSGADVYTERLASALRKRGHDVCIHWFPHWAEVVPAIMRREIRMKADIIHANSWNAFAFAGMGAPLVVTVHHCVHGSQPPQSKSLLQRLYHGAIVHSYERRSFASAHAVVAVSDYTMRCVTNVFGVPSLDVIHNWVDTDLFRPSVDSASHEGRPFRLLFVGNRSNRKGWDVLPDLMRRLGTGFELHYKAGLRGESTYERLPENMIAVSRQPNELAMARLYQGSDALLVPSRLEGFGYAALEAMACAKPVVAFRNSATIELVVSERNGLLVDTDDIEGLAAACTRLSRDREWARALGEEGRRMAETAFSEDAAADAYLRLYRRVIRRPNPIST